MMLYNMLLVPERGNNGNSLSFQGYFLLFESMLDSVLHARDLYLADSGSGRSHLLPGTKDCSSRI